MPAWRGGYRCATSRATMMADKTQSGLNWVVLQPSRLRSGARPTRSSSALLSSRPPLCAWGRVLELRAGGDGVDFVHGHQCHGRD
jgi:hypothetical protein